MSRACVLFRATVAYRREVFETGLKRLGYQIVDKPLPSPDSSDLLVMWNRSFHEEAHARRYESAGAKLIIAENGYIGKDEDGHKLFSLALNHHNGAGRWNVGTGRRWSQEPQTWRSGGDHVLVLPQRGIGEKAFAMPSHWLGMIRSKLAGMTKRPVRVRVHPGREKTEPYDELRGAWAAVTWGSGAGIKALFAGIPVFHELPQWIGASASMLMEGADIEQPFLGDRLPMFERLAWAQWSVREIESGEAFRCLLSRG